MHLSSLQATFVALTTLALASSTPTTHHHIARRSFDKLQCKGVYDFAMYHRLDRVCNDCYDLFQESQVYNLCRNECFTSPFFKACMESLYLLDEEEEVDQIIDYIGKR